MVYANFQIVLVFYFVCLPHLDKIWKDIDFGKFVF